jgi:hypothetical protein
MGWGKIVFIFQAIITLLMSLVFFSQVISLDSAGIKELNVEVSDSLLSFQNPIITTINIKDRYETAAYILFIISVIELILIAFVLHG